MKVLLIAYPRYHSSKALITQTLKPLIEPAFVSRTREITFVCKIKENGEISINQHCLIIQLCFPATTRQISSFKQSLICRLQML